MKFCIVLVGLLIGVFAHAEIYEVVDQNGHKTYTNKPPLNEVDIKQVKMAPQTNNTWQKSNIQEQNDQFFDELKKQQDEENAAVEAARKAEEEQEQKTVDAISRAEDELVSARELKAGDFVPNKKKGMHYTQDYLKRVKDAEEALQKVRAEANQ